MVCLAELKKGKEAVETLLKAIGSGRVAHSYLFSGPARDKGEVAEAFARALLCDLPRDGDSCGECRSCRQVLHGNHPDLHRIEPSGTAIRIEQIRRMQRLVQYRSYQGGRKVFILEPAESMTAEAANSLLKTLEEPPPGTVFVLVSDRPGACLPTVLSRCQPFYFHEAGASPVETRLDDYSDLACRLARTGPAEVLNLAAEAAAGDVPRLLDGLARVFRDTLVAQETGRNDLLFWPDREGKPAAESFGYDPGRLVEIIEEIEAARRRVERNVNNRLVLEVLFLSVACSDVSRQTSDVSRQY